MYSEHHGSLNSDAFFLLFWFCPPALSLKGYDNEVEAQNVGFNLGVYSSVSDERFRNDSTLYKHCINTLYIHNRQK